MFKSRLPSELLAPDYSGISRRRFVTGIGAAAAGMGLSDPAAAEMASSSQTVLQGQRFDLSIGYREVNFTGKPGLATVVNGSLPAPVLRWREGEEVVLNVRNDLAMDSSIHWHGMILPPGMDGVPGISFGGIRPGDTFQYRFKVMQSGTYWYHSHSGHQEQTGVYGAIVIDPAGGEPFKTDREHVVVLSDWTDEDPERLFKKLRTEGHYYNTDPRTLQDLRAELAARGLESVVQDRGMWNRMRMNDRDISDVTGLTYTFLTNGHSPDANWQGLFKRGERVRLRFVNAAAMTIFDVRIPGLKMTVVASDGQAIEPVTVDEFRMAVAETYDVIVEPEEGAYTLFAQAIDRSGYARGTLTEQKGLVAAVPALDEPPILSHGDMGMAMGQHAGHGAMNAPGSMDSMDHSKHNMPSMKGSMQGMDHSQHAMKPNKGTDHSKHAGHNMGSKLGPAGKGSNAAIAHKDSEFGFNVDMRVDEPAQDLSDPGIGLRNNGRRVLTYADVRNLYPTADTREPEREIQLHLTGNMNRYLWSMDGISFANAEPLQLKLGERARIVLVNDTMMNHPIHLHGMWSELETGDATRIPRKHTVIVQPGAKLSYLVTPDVAGDWAYHCHLLYHMMGMFRRVRVSA